LPLQPHAIGAMLQVPANGLLFSAMTSLRRAAVNFILDVAGIGLLATVGVLLVRGTLSELPWPLVAGVLLGAGFGLAQLPGRRDKL
jgi:hypothetical protein